MANNRLYLVNERLGLKVRLATYHPGSWSVVPGIDQRLGDAFLADDSGSQDGNEDWRLQYELEPSKADI